MYRNEAGQHVEESDLRCKVCDQPMARPKRPGYRPVELLGCPNCLGRIQPPKPTLAEIQQQSFAFEAALPFDYAD